MPTVTDFDIPIPLDTDPLANIASAVRDAIAALDQEVLSSGGATVNNSTALADVLDLGFLAKAGKTYRFQIDALFSCSSSAIDARLGMHRSVASGDLSYSVFGKKAGLGAGTSGDGEFGGVYHGSSTDYIAVGIASGITGARLVGTYKAIADATITFRFAQNVATATDLNLLDGSSMKVQVI